MDLHDRELHSLAVLEYRLQPQIELKRQSDHAQRTCVSARLVRRELRVLFHDIRAALCHGNRQQRHPLVYHFYSHGPRPPTDHPPFDRYAVSLDGATRLWKVEGTSQKPRVIRAWLM